MSSKLQLDVVATVRGGAIWWTRTKAKGRHGVVCRLNCVIHVWAPWGRDTCHPGRYINPRSLPLSLPYLLLVIFGSDQSFGLNTDPHSFGYLVITLSVTRWKSAQKFAVRVCQVTTVVMETTQLVLRQFKNYLSHKLRIKLGLSVPNTISKLEINMHHLPKAMQYRQAPWAIFGAIFTKLDAGEGVPSRRTSRLWL